MEYFSSAGANTEFNGGELPRFACYNFAPSTRKNGFNPSPPAGHFLAVLRTPSPLPPLIKSFRERLRHLVPPSCSPLIQWNYLIQIDFTWEKQLLAKTGWRRKRKMALRHIPAATTLTHQTPARWSSACLGYSTACTKTKSASPKPCHGAVLRNKAFI